MSSPLLSVTPSPTPSPELSPAGPFVQSGQLRNENLLVGEENIPGSFNSASLLQALVLNMASKTGTSVVGGGSCTIDPEKLHLSLCPYPMAGCSSYLEEQIILMVTSLVSVPFPSYEQSQAEPIELSSNSYFNLSLTLSQSYCKPVSSPTSQSFFLEFIWVVNENSPGPKRWLADLTESQPHISFCDGLSFCATNFSQLLLGKTVDREVFDNVRLLLFEIVSSWSCP